MDRPRPIARLPAAVAERIAAGEVIERPTSVVRELLDNALDAAARQVTIELRGGGLELIRVSDDGWGIPPDEVELAFERHATSKIATADDLTRLQTLGFRGEALPSIAAVAEVTLVSSVAGSAAAALVSVRAGAVLRRGRAARQQGTTVTVRQLFQNVPARLKFLPAARAESLLVGQLVRRYALAHPGVRLTLVVDGRLSFWSGGSGQLGAALEEVYGPAVRRALIPLPTSAVQDATISGYIGGAGATRPGRQHLTLLINRRWAANRELLGALEAAYRPHVPRGRHPIAAIVVQVPPADLDPNVHPSKTEVRLAREAEIGAALAASVRAALAQTPAGLPLGDLSAFAPALDQYRLPLRPPRVREEAGRWHAAPVSLDLQRAQIVGQARDTLIVVEGGHGLLLVDQHRAHERALFERALEHRAPGGAQSLLEPVVLNLAPAHAARLDARLSQLEALGFVCERFGQRDYLVRAVPSDLAGEEVVPHLAELLEDAATEEEGWRERLLIATACRAAIKRGRRLSATEMERLVRGLAEVSVPAVCPHGSPLILEVTGAFLERQFGW